jgi:hypothetical protein
LYYTKITVEGKVLPCVSTKRGTPLFTHESHINFASILMPDAGEFGFVS